jgi:hypothetical protein
MKIIDLTINTFREAIRDKVLYSLLLFAALMNGISFILTILPSRTDKNHQGFRLAAIEIFGVWSLSL